MINLLSTFQLLVRIQIEKCGMLAKIVNHSLKDNKKNRINR